jgi:hypothetical protein
MQLIDAFNIEKINNFHENKIYHEVEICLMHHAEA